MDLELQNSPHIISHVLAATTVESKLIGQYDWSTRAQEASHVPLQPTPSSASKPQLSLGNVEQGLIYN
jgi:hypothetical protein